ncbi:MAG TPA: phosphate ABC transporter permease subunit PstC [Thermoanaerobaculia bacterium]|jgi:phosphate transport system permease protein|nr:phosphate ABC transporter permease subunit PstC [Thermoanaerobaculia bacterium]
MTSLVVLAALLALSAAAYQVGRRRALAASGGDLRRLHSLPSYYGLYVAIWCVLPALLVLALWVALQGRLVQALVVSELPAPARQLPPERLVLLVNEVRNVAAGAMAASSPLVQAAATRYREHQQTATAALVVVTLALALAGAAWGWRRVGPRLAAITAVEKVVRALLLAGSCVAVLTTIGIVLSLLFEALRFFQRVPLTDFLFGLHWSPQTALRADQVGSSGSFGAVPLFTGTLLISGLAMAVAVPVGLFSAVFLAEYARPSARNTFKPLLEILAGIPTVVYGFFAALTVAPLLRRAGEALGLPVASESALAAGLVMGVMIIPFVSSLSDDVLTAVPRGLREASYGLGATKAETILRVVLPAALPGIVGSVMLAISRAIGETMIVVMAAGLTANLTANPLAAVTTVTVQIVTLLVGDQEFDSAKTLSAFALGLVLFVVTLTFNIIALHVVRRYRERYD